MNLVFFEEFPDLGRYADIKKHLTETMEGEVSSGAHGTGHHSREAMVEGASGSLSHSKCSHEARDKGWYSACFLCSTQTRIQVHGMMLT